MNQWEGMLKVKYKLAVLNASVVQLVCTLASM